VVTQPLVPAPEIGVVTAPGAPGVGEDEDLLPVLHKRLRFGEVGMGGPVLDRETVAIRIDLAHDPTRATCHLSHHVGPEPLDDLIERALDRLHRCQPFDQPVAPFDGFAALHRRCHRRHRQAATRDCHRRR